MNDCLRAARLTDIPLWYYMQRSSPELTGQEIRDDCLAKLYDAEWRKRGYPRSP